MNFLVRTITMVSVLGFLLAASTPTVSLLAEDDEDEEIEIEEEEGEYAETSTEEAVYKMSKRFLRGFVNVVFCWWELPKQVYRTTRLQNFGQGITVGVFKGTGMTFLRAAAGAAEMALFLSPWPDDWKPLLEPAYAFE